MRVANATLGWKTLNQGKINLPFVYGSFSSIASMTEQTRHQQMTPSNEAGGSQDIDADLLELLGSDLSKAEIGGPELQKDLAERWRSVLINGLGLEERKHLLLQAATPGNCLDLNPPKLNDLVKVALNEFQVKRDAKLVSSQSQLGGAIATIGASISALLREPTDGNRTCIKQLSDAGRLLTDLFHTQSICRRDLILTSINKDLKETLEQSSISAWLFGDNLEERIKSSKNLLKSGDDLKPSSSKTSNKAASLNFKRLPKVSSGLPQSRQPRQNPRGSQNNRAFYYRRTQDRAAPQPRRRFSREHMKLNVTRR